MFRKLFNVNILVIIALNLKKGQFRPLSPYQGVPRTTGCPGTVTITGTMDHRMKIYGQIYKLGGLLNLKTERYWMNF